ncbi:thioredoxin family protein [Rubritalea tangerina]|uniref:Thioredoxin family protein n=1 Tax=Rubritalea tangerina TaxID=430798 RepID=A0ABW4Z8B0_9BACT
MQTNQGQDGNDEMFVFAHNEVGFRCAAEQIEEIVESSNANLRRSFENGFLKCVRGCPILCGMHLRAILFSTFLASTFGALTSCAVISRNAKVVGEDFKEFTGLGDDGEKQGGGLKDLADIKPVMSSDTSQLYSEDMIEWANEDPDAPMAALDAIWEKGPVDNWYESYNAAMREARKEGKPVILWFTNSRSNTIARALSDELFSTSSFEDWAEDNVILLRVDSNVVDDDERRKDAKRKYVARLRKQYKVLGAPVVLMLSPRGSQFGKYVGYKTGDPEFYFGRLKNAHRNAMADYANWREEYEAKGYRVWHDNKGRKTFAKPYSLKDGVIYLKAPDGKRSAFPVRKLSREDQAWIEAYSKKKR